MTKITFRQLATAVALLTVLAALGAPAEAQTLRLRQAGTNQNRIAVQVGDVVSIEVFADLQGVASSGISFFITVPDAFQVNDLGLPGQNGNQPFKFDDSLFFGATVASNLLLPENDSVASTIPGQQLEFSAVIGIGSDRNRTGSGVVATLQLVAVQPIENGQIRIDDNAIRETKLVLADGFSDRRFVTTQGMEITVTGLELLDIPDVILQPGQADSIQIGSLDRYVQNTLSPADSIRWSFEVADPAKLDSLEVTVDPITRVVKIVPLLDFRGSVRFVWTALDPELASPGQPPLSATEVSTVVVNNRPLFDLIPSADGVKRDTVRMVEDRNTFIPGVVNLDARRAFRWIDLDLLVFDPDVDDPDIQLLYSVSTLPLGLTTSNANVVGTDSEDTHELLIWTRPDFGGTDSLGLSIEGTDTTTVRGGRDSLRVIVRDLFGGQDTLRVIVEVEEVEDGPRILETETAPRISRGGTKTYSLSSFVEDPDTPVENLNITWVNDPDDHFTVDTTRTEAGELLIQVSGDPAHTGDGRVVIRIEDPLNPDLFDEEVFFFTSSEALPPDVFPNNIKIPLSPGLTHIEDLNLLVSDPDNDDGDLRWTIPPVTQSTITIDQLNTMAVRAPDDFVGFEQTTLTVLDPGDQSDQLTLRIYSSDGRPVTGGIPDIVLDRGASDRTIDLDDFYHDANNSDEQMTWRALDTFDEDNVAVQIDGLTHVVTFAATQDAAFGTETVILRVTDTEGRSDADTVLVTVRAGGQGADGAFAISPQLPELEAPVGAAQQVLDLHDHLTVVPPLPRSSITWELVASGDIGIANVRRVDDAGDPDGVRWMLAVFSDSSGTDTLTFVATDSLGRSETATTTIRYFGESDILQLRAVPDIVFISGQAFSGLRLNDFVLDPVAHPDSVMQWTDLEIGSGEGTFIIDIDAESSVRVLSFDIGETEVVFTARDTVLGITGRDTVRVIAQDPALAAQELQPMPDLVLKAGSVDSSLVLNDFLPQGLQPSFTNWSVSGASLTVPAIDPTSPHRLSLSAVGTSIGTDTLSFRVDLGGGFIATGDLVVIVEEPTDESTLTLQVVPNPLSVNFVDFFVTARTEMTSSPTVVITFEGADTTVAVRQIEDDLPNRDVLIWAGSFQVRVGGTGTLLFRASAITALQTPVTAQASITIGTAGAGKPVSLRHGDVQVELPAGAIAGQRLVYLQAVAGVSATPGAAERPAGSASELTLIQDIRLYPAGLELHQPARLRLLAEATPGAGVYQAGPDGWRWQAGDGDGWEVRRFGRYGLLTDHTPPRLEVETGSDGLLRLSVTDRGSGYAASDVYAQLDGERFPARVEADGLIIEIRSLPGASGLRDVVLVAADRAGNESRSQIQMLVVERLPVEIALGINYPNPFNPSTTIPFDVPPGQIGVVRLRVYNATGQVVRELLNRPLSPGHHIVNWDGRDAAGRGVSSGIYYYRLEGSGRAMTRSMSLVK